ncbi:MAG: signal peptidase I [Lachnospiraceae bacterium]|nr:signal peptidase I [Lachnospiraceae bacterium]
MNENLKGWLEAVVEALIIVAVLYFVFFPVKVEGFSMENTLSDGDRVFVSRIMTDMKLYDRGDIVVFKHEAGGKNEKMVKRVIALEGERVRIENGNVYINEELMQEDYVTCETQGNIDVVVDKNKIFVMGDNREGSTDSRVFGAIDEGEVSGKVVMKLYPFDKFTLYR